ncbi:MAG TPA: S-layer homology domain-containing protein [Casimicrobiaceae bacterium]|nr:S-layer homology domain-containing protein [Casimicrobiaceae bacterium]
MPTRHAAGVLAAAALALLAAMPARAQQCDVFTDVQASDSFCNAVQWLKNRAITSGCTATAYCPNSDVTRAQMALFLNRLGVALTPLQFGTSLANTPPSTTLAPNQFLPYCQTATLPAATHARRARIRGYVGIVASGSTALQLFLVYDPNPVGPYVNANSVALNVPSPSGHHALAWASNVVPLAAGTSYRFAIGIANPPGASGTLVLGANECVIDVSVVDDVPGSAPPDAR